MPIFALVIGKMVNTLGNGIPQEGLTSQLNECTLFFVYLAIASFVVCYLEVAMWMLTGNPFCSCDQRRHLRNNCVPVSPFSSSVYHELAC